MRRRNSARQQRRTTFAPLRQLRRIRQARGLTQAQLAKRARMSRPLVRLLESGYAPRTQAAVDAIAAALDVEAAALSASVVEIVSGVGNLTSIWVAGSQPTER